MFRVALFKWAFRDFYPGSVCRHYTGVQGKGVLEKHVGWVIWGCMGLGFGVQGFEGRSVQNMNA